MKLTVDDVRIHAQALADRTGLPAYIYRLPECMVCTTEEPTGRRKPLATIQPQPKAKSGQLWQSYYRGSEYRVSGGG